MTPLGMKGAQGGGLVALNRGAWGPQSIRAWDVDDVVLQEEPVCAHSNLVTVDPQKPRSNVGR